MSRTINVNIEYLTRVEGHGNIVVNVIDGKLQECSLNIVEAPRFFEAMIRGRSIFEVQHITSRICGICSCGHTLASIQAAENAIGFVPSVQTMLLRKLLMAMEILDSHVLHIYLLAAPDLLGVQSFIPLIKSHNEVVRRALRMKKICNEICDILVGRHVHPISAIVGGFTKLPKIYELDLMLKKVQELEKDIQPTVDLFATFKFPNFTRETEYIALSNPEEYAFIDGEISSSDKFRCSKDEYKTMIEEFCVEHSSSKHTKANRDSYMVGALARFNINHEKLNSRAKNIADFLGLRSPVYNPYLNTSAQLVECAHVLEEAEVIIENLMNRAIDYNEEVVVGVNENSRIKVNAGRGVGAIEVPRGILFHEYEVDENGIVVDANCIIPTGQNLNNIERDMHKLVPELLDLDQEDIIHRLEMLVRAYDPCISCSAHFLNVKFSDPKFESAIKPEGKTILVTIGNDMRMDDGLGPYIANQLTELDVINVGDRPEDYVDEIIALSPNKIVFIDAADLGLEAGTIRLLDESHIPNDSVSTHTFPLRVIADIIVDAIGAKVVFVGIQPKTFGFGKGLSYEIERKADELVSIIRNLYKNT